MTWPIRRSASAEEMLLHQEALRQRANARTNDRQQELRRRAEELFAPKRDKDQPPPRKTTIRVWRQP